MRTKVGLGMVAATLVTFGLIACNSLFCQCPAEAQQPPPPPVAQVETPPPIRQAGPLLIRFTTSVSPSFEGGAVGEPVPLMVEIRGDGLSNQDIPLIAWQKNLPAKVREALEEALESAVEQAAYHQPPADRRLDQVLDRLERIERRLKQIERGKSGN